MCRLNTNWSKPTNLLLLSWIISRGKSNHWEDFWTTWTEWHSHLFTPCQHNRPSHLSVNKSARSFLQATFDEWYSKEINKQLQGRDWENVMLNPVDLRMPLLRELGAKWLLEMAEYLGDNPPRRCCKWIFEVRYFDQCYYSQEDEDMSANDCEMNEEDNDSDRWQEDDSWGWRGWGYIWHGWDVWHG